MIDNSAMKNPRTNQPVWALEWPWDRPSADSEAVSQCKQAQETARSTERSTGEKTEVLILVGELQLNLKAENCGYWRNHLSFPKFGRSLNPNTNVAD